VVSRKSSTASSTLEQQIWATASSASYQASSPAMSDNFRRGSSQSTVPSPCTCHRHCSPLVCVY
jgi:hypothetical protein